MSDKFICNYCKAGQLPGAKYCSECAKIIWYDCPHCQKRFQTDPKITVCPHCQQPVEMPKPDPRIPNWLKGKLYGMLITGFITGLTTWVFSQHSLLLCFPISIAGAVIGYKLGWRIINAMTGLVIGAIVSSLFGALVGGLLQTTIQPILGEWAAWTISSLTAGLTTLFFIPRLFADNKEHNHTLLTVVAIILTGAVAYVVASDIMPAILPNSSAQPNDFSSMAGSWAGGFGIIGLIWGALSGLFKKISK